MNGRDGVLTIAETHHDWTAHRSGAGPASGTGGRS